MQACTAHVTPRRRLARCLVRARSSLPTSATLFQGSVQARTADVMGTEQAPPLNTMLAPSLQGSRQSPPPRFSTIYFNTKKGRAVASQNAYRCLARCLVRRLRETIKLVAWYVPEAHSQPATSSATLFHHGGGHQTAAYGHQTRPYTGAIVAAARLGPV